MLAQIHVTFKKGVLDPQGKTVHHALNDLGYEEVLDVNIGKYLEGNIRLCLGVLKIYVQGVG